MPPSKCKCHPEAAIDQVLERNVPGDKNNAAEGNFQRAGTSADLLFGKHLLLRKGKRNYVVVTAK